MIARLLAYLTPDLWGDRETETAILAGFRQMRARLDTVKSEIAAIYDRNEGRSIRSTISMPVDGWIKVLVVVQDMDGKP